VVCGKKQMNMFLQSPATHSENSMLQNHNITEEPYASKKQNMSNIVSPSLERGLSKNHILSTMPNPVKVLGCLTCFPFT
jgi:hypothetical protein